MLNNARAIASRNRRALCEVAASAMIAAFLMAECDFLSSKMRVLAGFAFFLSIWAYAVAIRLIAKCLLPSAARNLKYSHGDPRQTILTICFVWFYWAIALCAPIGFCAICVAAASVMLYETSIGDGWHAFVSMLPLAAPAFAFAGFLGVGTALVLAIGARRRP